MILINSYTYAANGDPDFANVKALLHFDGSNGSTTFTDTKGHSFIATAAGPAISTAQSVFGQSIRLPGGAGVFRSNASETDFGLGTGQYTIEFWVRLDNVGTTNFIYDMRPLAAGLGPIIGMNPGGTWFVYLDGTFAISGGSASNNTWYHVALTRASGGTSRLFINGTQTGSSYIDTVDYSSSQYIVVGGPADAPTILQFVGYMDDLRLTRGVARYTTTFTPPVAPYPDS